MTQLAQAVEASVDVLVLVVVIVVVGTTITPCAITNVLLLSRE